MNEHWKHDTKWKKPDTKGQMLRDYVHRRYPDRQIQRESKLVARWKGAWGVTANGPRVFLWTDVDIQKLDNDDCTTFQFTEHWVVQFKWMTIMWIKSFKKQIAPFKIKESFYPKKTFEKGLCGDQVSSRGFCFHFEWCWRSSSGPCTCWTRGKIFLRKDNAGCKEVVYGDRTVLPPQGRNLCIFFDRWLIISSIHHHLHQNSRK